MKIFILTTETENVYQNLAYETALLNYVQESKEEIAILFLWKNDNTIVIGKHQNPLKECNMAFVKEHNINIARRITGGGAVYHDKGNINFSFISSNKIYSKEKNFEIITNAFKKLGINVELSGRNDILINGKKFSGNAYYQTKTASIHHGTILLTINKEIVSNALTPNKAKFDSKSVYSIQSRIINLKEIQPDITQEQIEQALIQAFKDEYKLEPLYEIKISPQKISELSEKYNKKSWIYKDYITPDKEISNQYPWGGITIKLTLESNKIKALNIISDTLETELIEEIEKKFINIDLKDIKTVFKNIQTKNITVLNDIYELIINALSQT